MYIFHRDTEKHGYRTDGKFSNEMQHYTFGTVIRCSMSTPTRSNSSRERVLACAEAIILQKGFSGTLIEDLLEKAAITKGGFFYHFDGNPGLAQALVERYLKQDDTLYRDLMKKAAELSEDPLHRLPIFLKLLFEMLGQMEEAHLLSSARFCSHKLMAFCRAGLSSNLLR